MMASPKRSRGASPPVHVDDSDQGNASDTSWNMLPVVTQKSSDSPPPLKEVPDFPKLMAEDEGERDAKQLNHGILTIAAHLRVLGEALAAQQTHVQHQRTKGVSTQAALQKVQDHIRKEDERTMQATMPLLEKLHELEDKGDGGNSSGNNWSKA